jgi:hypothetical protein
MPPPGTGSVAADVADELPEAFPAVTRTRSRWPRSSSMTPYFAAEASGIASHAEPAALQRRQANA